MRPGSTTIDPQRVWSSAQLPTLPTVAARLLELVRDPESTISHVVQVIKTDPAISAKLIKSANSSYFGLRSEVKGVDRAVSVLGTTVSTSLALSFVLSDDSMKGGPLAIHYRRYWRQSVAMAAAAEYLSTLLSDQDASEYFLTGLLLGMGRLAILKALPREYLPVLEQAETAAEPLVDVEQTTLGFDHVSIGARLLEHWNLPKGLIRAVQWQRHRVEHFETLRGDGDFLLNTSAAIAACVGDYYCAACKGPAVERMRGLLPLVLGPEADLGPFLVKCQERIQAVGPMFDLDMTDLGSSTDLMVQANEQLLNLTLREHASNTQAQMNQQALSQEKVRLEEQNRLLQSQAMHDPLTGLHNRKFLDEALAREANRAQRQATPLAVLFADVDHFKRLNDTYGHQFGDFVLKTLSLRLQESIRVTDVLARYGGEEFVILVHQPTERGLETLAQRIRERMANEPFVQGETTVHVTCSLGGAIAIPGRRDRNIGERLLAAADRAMYQAKSDGRNRVCMESLIADEDRAMQKQVTAHRFSRWLVAQGYLEVATVSRALLECPVTSSRIGELAEQQAYLTHAQVDAILAEQVTCEERFGTIALRRGDLTSEQLIHLLTLQHENPAQLTAVVVRLGLLAPDRAAAALEDYSLRYAPVALSRAP
jgi:two-component system, cell cycle response regulator